MYRSYPPTTFTRTRLHQTFPPLLLKPLPHTQVDRTPMDPTQTQMPPQPFPRGDFKHIGRQPIITDETGPRRLQLALLVELNTRSANISDKPQLYQKYLVDRRELVQTTDQWKALKHHFFVTCQKTGTWKLDRPIVKRFCKLCGVLLKHLKRMTDGQLKRLAKQMIDGCEVLIYTS
jgi:hypothetical protein